MNIAIIGLDNAGIVINQFRKYAHLGVFPVLLLDFNKVYKETLGEDSFCANFEMLKRLYGNGVDAVYVNLHAQYKTPWVVKKLLDSGIDNIYVPYPAARIARRPIFDGNGFVKQNVYHVTRNKPFIGHLEIHVVDRCNLNCKSCTHFSPLSKEQSVSLEGIKRDIQRMAELFDNILECWILGGEPFLEPDLVNDVILAYREYFPRTELRVVTNGLLIPELEHRVFDTMKENNVMTMISSYEPTRKIFDQLVQKLDAYGIRHIAFQMDKFFVMKTETPYFDPQKSNDLCNIAETAYLMNGKLSKCPESMLIKKFDDYFDTSLYQKEEFDIYQEIDGWALFNKLLAPIASCGYCNVAYRELRPWEVCDDNPRKEYWLTENQVGGVYEYKDRLETALTNKDPLSLAPAELVDMYLSYQKTAVHDYFAYRVDHEKLTYVLFGASSAGRECPRIISARGMPVFFCDNNEQKHGALFEGFQVISPAELKKIYDKQTHKILITSSFFSEIFDQLKNDGIISDVKEIMPVDGTLNDLFAEAFKRSEII